jgi:hypothetical protein
MSGFHMISFDESLPQNGENESDDSDEPHMVIIYLDTSGLPDEVYEQYDMLTLEEQLTEVVEREQLGVFDGSEYGMDRAALFLLGPDGERLFAGIESTLRAYPLCQGASIVIDNGDPDGTRRELTL